MLDDTAVEPNKSMRGKVVRGLRELLSRLRHSTYSGGAYSFNRRSTVILFSAILAIGLITCGTAYYASMQETPVSKQASLQGKLWSLISEQRFAEGILVADELIAIAPRDDVLRLQKALIHEQLGQDDAAREIMLELEQRRNADAAVWLLDDGFDLSDVAHWDSAQRTRFEELSTLACRSMAANKVVDVSNRLASYYLATGDHAKAIETLADLGERDPSSLINAAALAFKVGDPAQGRKYALQGMRYFENVVSDNPIDDSSRLQLARAMTITDAEEQAIKLLSDGFQLTQQPALQQAAGEVLVSWANRIKSQGNPVVTFLPRMQLLHRAAQCAPQDAAVLAAHIELLKECNSNRKLRLASLESALSLGFELEAAHFLLGVWLALDDQPIDACVHLQLATKSGPHLPTVVNNLALAMCQRMGDLDGALSLSNLAHQVLPEQPQFFETRGRILIALERFEEAIPDFISALELEELKPIVYPQLMAAYRKTGDATKATEIEADLERLKLSTLIK